MSTLRSQEMSSYGQRGGSGPNAGKKATTYIVTLPDGSQHKKLAFPSTSGDQIATAFRSSTGKIFIAVWTDGNVAWEGDFGRLVAKPVRK